jgi:gamma-glutamyltranspeptidase / glutathione hydrolase
MCRWPPASCCSSANGGGPRHIVESSVYAQTGVGVVAGGRLPVWAAQPVHARHAMVVTVEQHATDAGVAVLEAGGNAVDAAVAVGFALAVTHPSAGNIGGGGFMLVRLADGRTTFIDFRERAPEKASRNMYLDASGKATRIAWWAIARPEFRARCAASSTPRRSTAGSPGRTWWRPAVALAEKASRSPTGSRSRCAAAGRWDSFRNRSASSCATASHTKPGETFVQPELARTLRAHPRARRARFL